MENEKFDVFVDNSKYDWDDGNIVYYNPEYKDTMGNIVCQDIFLKIV